MTIIQIINVSTIVRHTTNNYRWKLTSSCLNSDLSIMKKTKIRSTQGSIFLFLLYESDLTIRCNRRCSRFDRFCQLFIFRKQHEHSKESFVNTFDSISTSEYFKSVNKTFNRKFGLFLRVSWSQECDILIFREAFGFTVLLSCFCYKFMDLNGKLFMLDFIGSSLVFL